MYHPESVFMGARDSVLEAGHFIRSQLNVVLEEQISDKGLNQLVSFVDKEAEKMLVHGLSHVLPGSGFITEEDTVSQKREEFTWIIDPLDGTTNFLHGLPAFAVSVGLMRGDALIMGLVYDVVPDQLYYALENQPAFCNDKEICVSKTKSLNKALLATGFPYYNFEVMDPYIQSLQYFMLNSQGLRRMGSAALDLAYTACGRFDGFFEWGLSPWDVAAGALIVKQAGGNVDSFDGKGDFLFGKTVLAGTPLVFEPMKAFLQTKFK